MRHRIKSNPGLVWGLVVLATGIGVAAVGCAEDTSQFPPGSQPPNSSTKDAGTGTIEAGPEVDLCGCAVMLDTVECRACNKTEIAPGASCAAREDTCQASPDCIDDALCIGDCLQGALGDAGDELACVQTCLAGAGSAYVNYLKCVCTRCDVCTSEHTCPAP